MRWLIATFLAMAAPPQLFEDRTAGSGIRFVLQNSATPEKHQIETMVGGVAVLDFDGDGLPDVFFANGAEQPSLKKTGPKYCNRLYRNRGDWTFEDVTDKAGICGEGFSMGAAVGDFDNDGRPDLFVAGVNQNILYRNRGDGTFEDVTARSGLANQGRWSVGAGWFDYDGDGRLDLFVVNYVKWDPSKEQACGDPLGKYRNYCHPKFYEGLPSTLYHNNGDGTFSDVSVKAGIAKHVGKGMSVALADYDGDGRVDIFVANDAVPNFLFHNEGDGTFQEVGFPAGVAMNDDGRALSSMGSDFRDMDGDGKPDLFVTALANETFPYYRNLGKGVFEDLTYSSRIGSATMAYSGWGAGVYDFDNDGRKDLFAACGDVQDNTELFSSRKSRQANLLMLAAHDGTFGVQFVGVPAQHRGAAFADFDRDGRVDVVVARIGEAPLLLRNSMGRGNHWLGVQLEGSSGLSNRDAVGAVVRVVTAAGVQTNHVTASVGYASSSELTVHFGLGGVDKVQRIEVRWPSGAVQVVEGVAVDRYVRIRERP